MTKRYTLTECYALLQVDPKTFRKWLEKAGLKETVMKGQVSKADERVKYLTQEQLELLATRHERTLPQTVPQHETTVAPGAYKLLADQIEELHTFQSSVTDWIKTWEKAVTDFTQQQQQDLKTFRSTCENLAHEIDAKRADQQCLDESVTALLHDQERNASEYKDDIDRHLAQQGETQVQQLAEVKAALTSRLEELVSTISTQQDALQQIRSDLLQHASQQEDIAARIEQYRQEAVQQLHQETTDLVQNIAALTQRQEEIGSSVATLVSQQEVQAHLLEQLQADLLQERQARERLSERLENQTQQSTARTRRAAKTAPQEESDQLAADHAEAGV